MPPIPRLRFKIVALLAIAIVVNYLDRQNFPVVISEVEKEIPLSNQQYSQLQSLFLFPFLAAFLWLVAIAFVVGGVWYAVTHVQYAIGLPGYSYLQTLHFTAPKMQFYDKHLDNAVWYARHAMSIDENRADFARVPWGSAQNKGPPNAGWINYMLKGRSQRSMVSLTA